MATCHCVGDSCVCEAIHVPPKLSFWKKHDRHVHGMIAWTALLNAAMLAIAPVALFAAAPSSAISNASAPPVISGVENCVQRCETEKSRCEEWQDAACEIRTQECYSRCSLSPQLGLPLKEKETFSASSSEERARARAASAKKLATAKKRIAEFSRNLATLKTKMAQIEKKGMKIPPGLKEAMKAGETLVKNVKSASSTEDVAGYGDVQAEMDKTAELLKNGLSALEKQRGASAKFAALEKQLRQFDHQLATIKKIAAGNAEIAPMIAGAEGALKDLKDAYRQAHDAIVAGDVEGGFKALQEQVPALMASYKEAIKNIHAARAEKIKT